MGDGQRRRGRTDGGRWNFCIMPGPAIKVSAGVSPPRNLDRPRLRPEFILANTSHGRRGVICRPIPISARDETARRRFRPGAFRTHRGDPASTRRTREQPTSKFTPLSPDRTLLKQPVSITTAAEQFYRTDNARATRDNRHHHRKR